MMLPHYIYSTTTTYIYNIVLLLIYIDMTGQYYRIIKKYYYIVDTKFLGEFTIMLDLHINNIVGATIDNIDELRWQYNIVRTILIMAGTELCDAS